jgi:catechol-2,3-dioxygenase
MTSIYCEDPDGNIVEVATYSADRCAGWSVLAVLKLFLAVDAF